MMARKGREMIRGGQERWVEEDEEKKRVGAHIDHPVGDLRHGEARGVAEHLLLVLGGVWVVRVAMEPGLEEVGGLLGELSALALGAIYERRRGHCLLW